MPLRGKLQHSVLFSTDLMSLQDKTFPNNNEHQSDIKCQSPGVKNDQKRFFLLSRLMPCRRFNFCSGFSPYGAIIPLIKFKLLPT
jgi:hypothetical protein